jgi:methyl-accepting chemotaxis protein
MIVKIFRIMHLGSLTIKARLGVGLGLIIAFMVVLTFTGIWSLSGINSKLEQIIKIDNAKIEQAYAIQNAVSTLDKSVLTIVMANDESVTKAEKKKIDDAREAYKISLEKLAVLETTAEGKKLIEEIKQNTDIARNAKDQVIELAAAGNMGQASNILGGSLQISALLAETCNEMVKFQQAHISASVKDAYATYTRARYFLLIIGAAVFVFAIFLASFLSRSITKPLNEGVLVAQRISEGDLTARIEVIGKDETSQLLGAMKDMVMKLQNIISGVKTAAGNIASASNQLNSSSELMSQGAGEQAGRASQVATASEEMSQTILDIAKNTSSIEASATDTANLAKSGEAVVDSSVEKVKSIAKTIDESAKLIRSLGDRSNQIGEIVTVINDIADQTNLLALNAAIEAARAGDVGRGFAVVADEVKKLAERAGNSTAEISGMVKAIQNEVHQIVISMENITKEVKSGVDLSTQAGDVLRNIVGGVNQLHVMVQQIASATEEMAATSEEINKDIETIASVSKDTSGSSTHIAKASQELAELSVNLENVIGGFKV